MRLHDKPVEVGGLTWALPTAADRPGLEVGRSATALARPPRWVAATSAAAGHISPIPRAATAWPPSGGLGRHSALGGMVRGKRVAGGGDTEQSARSRTITASAPMPGGLRHRRDGGGQKRAGSPARGRGSLRTRATHAYKKNRGPNATREVSTREGSGGLHTTHSAPTRTNAHAHTHTRQARGTHPTFEPKPSCLGCTN